MMRIRPAGRPPVRLFTAFAGVVIAGFALALVGAGAAVADSVVTTIPAVSNGRTALSPDGSLLYATNTGTSFSVIDTATNTVVDTGVLPVVGGKPAVSPDGTRLYVPQPIADNLAVVDTATLAVLTTVPVGDNPFFAAISPDGSRVYVSNANGTGVAGISVVDTATNTNVDTFSTPVGPRAVTVSADGTRLYVATQSASSTTLTVLDTSTGGTVATISLGVLVNRIDSLVLSTDGTRIYASRPGLDTVSVIDVATTTITGTIPVGDNPQGIAATPDGTRVYVVNTLADSVSVIDTATNTAVSTVAVGDGPRDIEITPDSLTAYVGNSTAGTVSVIALDTFPAITTTTLPDGDENVAYAASIVTTGTPTPTVAVTSGTFPPGLTLDPAGAITGAPTTPGSYTFEVTASSSVSGIASTAVQEYTVVIAAAPVVPSAPLNLDAAPAGSAIALNWDAPASDGGAAITGYRIERSVDGGPFAVLVADTASPATAYSDTSVTPGTVYTYRVIALNAVGAGAASNIDSAVVAVIPAPADALPVTGVDSPALGTSLGVLALLIGGVLVIAARRTPTR